MNTLFRLGAVLVLSLAVLAGMNQPAQAITLTLDSLLLPGGLVAAPELGFMHINNSMTIPGALDIKIELTYASDAQIIAFGINASPALEATPGLHEGASIVNVYNGITTGTGYPGAFDIAWFGGPISGGMLETTITHSFLSNLDPHDYNFPDTLGNVYAAVALGNLYGGLDEFGAIDGFGIAAASQPASLPAPAPLVLIGCSLLGFSVWRRAQQSAC